MTVSELHVGCGVSPGAAGTPGAANSRVPGVAWVTAPDRATPASSIEPLVVHGPATTVEIPLDGVETGE